MLAGVEALRIEADDPARGIGEERARAGGEILQSGADRENEIGLPRRVVGRARAGHADRAEIERMIVRQRALAGLRFRHRDAVRRAEGREIVFRFTVEDAAAGDDERTPGRLDKGDGLRQLRLVGPRPARLPDALGEEPVGIVESFGLHVLAERERHGAAFGRIRQHLHRALEGGHDLLGPGDAVEITRDGPEAVIGGDGPVAEILDLLQHRIGAAPGEDVARQQQHRQAIDVRDGSSRHHIGRAWPDRARHRHHTPAARGLGEGDRGMCHRLLIMGAQGRQTVARGIQRLAEAGDIAMPEDRPDPGEDRQLLPVDHRLLRCHRGDERLRHGEPDRRHHLLLLNRAARLGPAGRNVPSSRRPRLRRRPI